MSERYLTIFVADPESVFVTQNKTLCVHRYPLAARAGAAEAISSVYKDKVTSSKLVVFTHKLPRGDLESLCRRDGPLDPRLALSREYHPAQQVVSYLST
jgi:hypothetical protein